MPAGSNPGASPLDGLSSAAFVAKWTAQTTDAAPPQVTARVDTPLGAEGWGDAFQQKIVWMVDRQQQSAELHINPPHLGPVDVMLNLTDDGAKLAFVSPHEAVREAIQASLPDLQTALSDRGVTVSQSFVGADSGAAREQFGAAFQGNDTGERSGSRQTRGSAGTTAQVGSVDTPRRAVTTARGLVDIFA
jgi:flagellar hook-length control protein FliK